MKVVLHLTNPNLNIYNIQVNRKVNLFKLSYKNLLKFGVRTVICGGEVAEILPEVSGVIRGVTRVRLA